MLDTCQEVSIFRSILTQKDKNHCVYLKHTPSGRRDPEMTPDQVLDSQAQLAC